jgi:HAMP domain-containing protein
METVDIKIRDLTPSDYPLLGKNMCQFLSDFAAGTLSTIVGAMIIFAAVAWVKARRLKKEFSELSELLRQALDARTEGIEHEVNKAKMEMVKVKIDEVISEVGDAKEGIISVSHGFRRELQNLKRDVAALSAKLMVKDLHLMLTADAVVERQFRSQIDAAAKTSDQLRSRLSCATLLFP